MGVCLSTFHSAKGLEFDTVFMIGIKPPKTDSHEDIEEERRLFYVAMTRAINRLNIYYESTDDVCTFINEIR